MKTTNFPKKSFLLLGGMFTAALMIIGGVGSSIPHANATGTSKIVVSRVNYDNAYFSGTKANVDGSISGASAKLVNPASFTNIVPGSHTVSVSKQLSSLVLKNFKMCTSPDATTTCTPNIAVSFTCTTTECTTSNINVGSRPVYVQAQFGSKYTTWK